MVQNDAGTWSYSLPRVGPKRYWKLVESAIVEPLKRADAKHLEWLRDTLGDRFLAGAVLHTGSRPFQITERILALPIATLWG